MSLTVNESYGEGAWVCIEAKTGKRFLSESEETPAGCVRYWFVDHTAYDSPEAYAQLKEQARLNGIKLQALFDENPDGYPPCSADPPHPASDPCGWENCPLHNILWLRSEGLSLEIAIGLTALMDYQEREQGGVVFDALGGWESWDALTDNNTVWEGPKLAEWYAAHKPLVAYVVEKAGWNALEYWWNSQGVAYRIPKYVEWSMLVQSDGSGSWVPYQLPGHGLVFASDDWPDVSKSDPTYNGADYWLTHHWATIRFDVG